jgi:hypothetical protein
VLEVEPTAIVESLVNAAEVEQIAIAQLVLVVRNWSDS